MTTESLAILFTDIVDSTVHATSAEPEAADQTRRRHFSTLRRCVVECEGTEVKGLGDGIMVVFSSPSRALECAAAMQRRVELDNWTASRPIGLRVGLSAGEVSVEDGDYFGDPVVEAARLCSQCSAGEILSASVVELSAGRRNRQNTVPVGMLELKGLPDPVPTIRVLWDPISKLDPASPPSAVAARLEIIASPGAAGSQQELAAFPLVDNAVIGREPDVDLPLPGDDAVSRAHALVERVDAGWSIRDLGSTNGTLVNGVRLRDEHLLQPGDEIRVGRTQLIFWAENTGVDVGGTIRIDYEPPEPQEPMSQQEPPTTVNQASDRRPG